MTTTVTDFFAPNYLEARKRLLRATDAAGVTVTSHPHPGPSINEHTLYSDVIWIGAKSARHVLLIISGTHGIEGFAGSAIQIACLESVNASGLPDDTALVLIHGLNPYGFAWYRRVDEDNVDVNRNFINHSAGAVDNVAYDDLHAVLCPDEWNEATRRRGEEALIEYQARYGRTAAESVLARGQHRHPDGLFFRGRAPCWSARLLRSVLRAMSQSAERLTLLDIHTGLGSYGGCQLICGIDEASPRVAAVRRWLGDGSMFLGLKSGFERLPGAIDSASEEVVTGPELTPVTVEFGTLPALEVLQALRADNWLHRSSRHPDLDCPIKREMRRAFYPEDPDWRELVLLRGRQVVARAIDGLNA